MIPKPNKKRIFVVIVIFLGFLTAGNVRGVQGTSIIIDGNLDDWAGLDPIIREPMVNETYFLDINSVFITANGSHLFVRVDYEAPLDYWNSLLANMTIRTPDGAIYILMAQIIYDTLPHWGFTAIVNGLDLLSPYNNIEVPESVAEYQDSIAIDLTTKRIIEYYYLLADLGLTINDSIDITVWHYDSIKAGGTTYQGNPILALTKYNVKIANPSMGPELSTTSTTSMSMTDSTKTSEITEGFHILFTISIMLIVIVYSKRQDL